MGSHSIPIVLPRIQDPDLAARKYLNLLLVLQERRQLEVHVDAMPFEVTVDPATLCQLRCPYCSTGAGTMDRTQAILKDPVHRKMLDDLSESLFLIWYFSTGEPLLNKELPSLIRQTKDKEVYSIISTNLSLPLSDEKIDELLHCGIGCISASIDGASAETYVQYRRRGKFDLVMTNLRRLVERKKELGLEYPLIEWRFLVFKHNQHEVETVRQMALEVGVDLLEFMPGSTPPDATEVLPSDPMDLNPVISGPAIDRAIAQPRTAMIQWMGESGFYDPPTIRGERGYGKKCDWLYFGSTLFPNGSVSPCCLSNDEPDDFGQLGGDVHFENVWNNERYLEARSLWTQGPEAWEKSELVCTRCPNRNAQDYQFRTSIQAVLRNAPDWVLKVLSADADRFFLEVDYRLSPLELGALRKGALRFEGSYPDIDARLEALQPGHSDTAQERIEWIRDALAGPC